jgi:L-alanine-DL-glutamate epimerase-like enolase superfamily enzyme
VNALLDCAGSPEECAKEAQRLAAMGYTTLKVKVRHSLS